MTSWFFKKISRFRRFLRSCRFCFFVVSLDFFFHHKLKAYYWDIDATRTLLFYFYWDKILRENSCRRIKKKNFFLKLIFWVCNIYSQYVVYLAIQFFSFHIISNFFMKFRVISSISIFVFTIKLISLILSRFNIFKWICVLR